MAASSYDFTNQGRIAQLARTYWLPPADAEQQNQLSAVKQKPFKADLVERIYREDLISFGFSHRRCMILELAQYLECWLWPHFTEECSRAHVISICSMVNEKARERVPIWQCFLDNPDNFPILIHRVLEVLTEDTVDVGLLLSDTPDDDQKSINGREDARKCLTEHIVLVTFLSHCLTSLAEVGVLRRCLKDIYSLAVWRHLQPQRLERELKNTPARKLLRKLEKKVVNLGDSREAHRVTRARSFVALFVDRFLGILESIHPGLSPDPLLTNYLQRCLLLLIDFSSMLLTRRFLMVLMDDRHTVIRCKSCFLYKGEEGQKQGDLFTELVDIFAFYAQFQVDETTGEAVDASELDSRHCKRLNQLQLAVYGIGGRDGIYRDFAVANPSAYETLEKLTDFLEQLPTSHVQTLAAKFGFLPPTGEEDQDPRDDEPASKKRKVPAYNIIACPPKFTETLFEKDMLTKLLLYHFVIRESHLAQMNSAPLYPTEDLLWNENLVPSQFYSGDECLALPKLGLQFLTLQDYLMRNFTLFRLESTFEIRQDLEDSISRMKPWSGEQGQVVFDGWSRMALPIQAFNIIEVGKPTLGAKHPSRVRADVRVVVAGLRADVQKEWQGLRRHDPVFLVTVRPLSQQRNWKYNPRKPFLSQIGIVAVRGCEIEGQVDKTGKLIPDEERFGLVPKKEDFDAATTSPTWRVSLDACQYQTDITRLRIEKNRGKVIRAEIARAKREGRTMEAVAALERKALEAEMASPEDVYDTFNVLIRRKPKENNFKAVLDTIRDLMNTRSVVPDWLLDLLMGYGNPGAAHYSCRPDHYEPRQNWFDTFLSPDHLHTSFPQYLVRFTDANPHKHRQHREVEADCVELDAAPVNNLPPPPPYRLTFPPLPKQLQPHVTKEEPTPTLQKPVLEVESYTPVGSKVPWHLLTIDCPTWLPGNVSDGGKPGNRVPFTPRQVEAIRAAMQSGLTMVVGPPGTGKTDIAVQTIHNLYHNYPGQRILVVTHSNQALNQLFEKIIALDIDERHLLRLGHGEESLETTKDFSRYGRVDYILSKRLELLQKVALLRKSLELEFKAAEAKRRAELRKHRHEALLQTMTIPMELTVSAEGPKEATEILLDTTDPTCGSLSTPEEIKEGTEETNLKETLEEPTLATNTAAAEPPTSAAIEEPSAGDVPPQPAPLSNDLDASDNHMYTCETAQYFFLQEVLPRWEWFTAEAAQRWNEQQQQQVASDGEKLGGSFAADFVSLNFPFTSFVTGQANPPEDLVRQIFPGRDFTEDLSTARSCFRAISAIFNNLEEFRAFELMRTGLERANFLLTQEAKIVAMTCTHAALKRRDLVQLGFTYDTIIMEEAAQILEIETFIPLLLQNPDISGCNRLKRWIMIGDHNQLPPVVKNQAFNNYSNMGQSLFTRLVKLGVPTIQLDGQGRTRPSISRLYSWRYDNLSDIPHVVCRQEYRLCNPGFRFECQLVNVDDYKGVGESEPSAYFYQNLAEAEYVVATFMYMRIIGYPADKITILTTYNGQKHLIRDVINARCASNPLLGKPRHITTVDRFQGQQNDYVLVSLVRTHTVGHLRDVRRLVVTLSRARLGLYIFARADQFSNCQELRPAFDRLLGRRGLGEPRPTKFHLTPWEIWRDPRNPTSSDYLRQMSDDPKGKPLVVIEDMPQMATYVSKLYEERMKDLVSQHATAKGSRKCSIPPTLKTLSKSIALIPETEEKTEDRGRVDYMDVEEKKQDSCPDSDAEMKPMNL